MDLEYRRLLAPNGSPLIPPSDFRSPKPPRPSSGAEFMQRTPDSGQMEKTRPVTGKRRGGNRKACNECKQQKVSRMHTLDRLFVHLNEPCVSRPPATNILIRRSFDAISFRLLLRHARAAVGWESTARLSNLSSAFPSEGMSHVNLQYQSH